MSTHNPPTRSVPVLDVITLSAVHKEVRQRARDWRSAYQLTPLSPAMRSDHDPRMVRVDELESLGRWLTEQINESDRADLTDAGREVLAS